MFLDHFFFCQVAITGFAVYIFTGHVLNASKAFVALSLINVLRFPLVMFPDVLISTIQVRHWILLYLSVVV